MATLVGEIRDKEETALSLDLGGSNVQINEGMEECNHFSIRGFVRKQRKKDTRLCSPFISDGDGDKSNNNNNNIASSLDELPPLDVYKFKWWRCSGCLQDCNSSQGEGSIFKGRIGKILPSKRRKNEFLRQETSSFSNLLSAKEAGGCISDNQRSAAKEKQLVEEEPNLKGKRLQIQDEDDDDVFSTGLDCFGTPRTSRRSAGLNKLNNPHGGAISKLVMGPPKTSSMENSSTRPEAYGSAKTTSAISYHQHVRIRHNADQTTTSPPPATICKKTKYAKRSVQQPDRAVGDVHRGVTLYSQTIQHNGVAKRGDSLMPERLNYGHVPPQLGRNQVLGSSSTCTKKVSNYSTAGRAPERGQSHQFVEDSDGADKFQNSVCPLVESNRLFKKPRIDFELEAAGRSNMYAHLRRGPKIRLLSDLIAKNPTNAGMQQDNPKAWAPKFSDQSTKRKTFPVASHETPSEGRGISDEAAAEQSTKPKNPRFASHDDSSPRRGVSVSPVSWNKRKRTVSPNASNGSDAEKKSEPRVQNASPSSVHSQSRQGSRDNCEMPLSSSRFSLGQAAISTPVHGCQATDGTLDKSNKNIFYPNKDKRIQGFCKHISIPQIGKDYQPATIILQFGPENAPEEGASDSITAGRGSKRNHTEKGDEKFSAPSTMTDHLTTSVSTGNELWNSHVQAGGSLVEYKGGEQKGIKGLVKDIDINSIPVDDKAPEQGVADEIPMDIVEVLAKLRQHERPCDPNREKLSVQDDVNVGENSSAQKLNSSCLLKPQASYSYASNGAGRLFEPILTSSKENKISSCLFDQSWKDALVDCPNDDRLGARFTTHNTQSQVHVPGAAVKSWKRNMGSFCPVSHLQPAVQSMFNRPPPTLNTEIWVPRSMSSTEYAGAENGGGRQNIIHQFVFPWAASPCSNETIPGMQLLNFVQTAGSSCRSSGNTAEFLRKSKVPFDNPANPRQYSSKPPYAPGPHFEPYNKLRTGGSSCTLLDMRCPASAAPAVTCHTPSMTLIDRRLSSGNKTTKPKKKPAPSTKTGATPRQSAQKCVTNRNPAEMILDFKQVRSFMISPEDLRRCRKATISPKPHTVY